MTSSSALGFTQSSALSTFCTWFSHSVLSTQHYFFGSEIVVRKLTEMGAEIVIHDPYVKHWWELEKQAA